MAGPGDPPEFLTTREVARLLRVRERKVYEMAAAGTLPCRRLTGKLLFPRAEIERRLGGEAAPAPAPAVVAGSHDPLLEWAIRESGSGLATFFDGSADGLERLAAGEAAAAGVHLPEEDGGWNRRAVAQRLGEAPAVLLGWAWRRRGLLLAPALAGAVRGVADLEGRRVVRRQEGAGGGLLLERALAEAGVAGVRLTEEVARTEHDAAAAVASGGADAAPGLEAMARPFGLAFLPLVEERFDLAADRRAWFEPPLQRLMAFARGPAFAAKAEALGGYDLAEHGAVRWNGP